MSRVAVGVWLSLLLVVPACGSSDGARQSPGAPVAAGDFPALAAAAYCRSVAHCCTKGAADCVSSVQTMLQSTLDGAAAHKNVYDPAKARTCVDAISALADGALCATWFMSRTPSLNACNGVLDGTVEPGAPCDDVTNCKRGTLDGTEAGGFAGCAMLGGGSDNRCRTFVPSATLGASCFDDRAQPFAGSDGSVAICAAGLVCTGGSCVAEPGVGEACTGSCKDSFCSSSQCTAFAAEGADCSQVACALGFVCSANVCVAEPSVPWILSVGFWSTSYACPG